MVKKKILPFLGLKSAVCNQERVIMARVRYRSDQTLRKQEPRKSKLKILFDSFTTTLIDLLEIYAHFNCKGSRYVQICGLKLQQK